MQVAHSLNQLLKDYFAFKLSHPRLRLFFQMMLQGNTLAQLHHQVHMSSLIDDLKETHDIRVL